MTRKHVNTPLEELRNRHAEKAREIRERLADFSVISPDDYFYELVYCLLTPQSSAANAGRVVTLLRENDLRNSPIDPEPFLRRKECYIRFHRTKAQRLTGFRERYPSIHPHLCNGSTGMELREWLVGNVKGLGWKEASHFLRNIGHRNLAILDRHILRNLVRYGAVRRLPKTLTKKQYLSIEKKFSTFAERVGIPMDELDLLFWWMETGTILK